MQKKPDAFVEPSPEQVFYARVLEIGMYVGLGCLLVTFVVYASGVMENYIPLDDLGIHIESFASRPDQGKPSGHAFCLQTVHLPHTKKAGGAHFPRGGNNQLIL